MLSIYTQEPINKSTWMYSTLPFSRLAFLIYLASNYFVFPVSIELRKLQISGGVGVDCEKQTNSYPAINHIPNQATPEAVRIMWPNHKLFLADFHRSLYMCHMQLVHSLKILQKSSIPTEASGLTCSFLPTLHQNEQKLAPWAWGTDQEWNDALKIANYLQAAWKGKVW